MNTFPFTPTAAQQLAPEQQPRFVCRSLTVEERFRANDGLTITEIRPDGTRVQHSRAWQQSLALVLSHLQAAENVAGASTPFPVNGTDAEKNAVARAASRRPDALRDRQRDPRPERAAGRRKKLIAARAHIGIARALAGRTYYDCAFCEQHPGMKAGLGHDGPPTLHWRDNLVTGEPLTRCPVRMRQLADSALLAEVERHEETYHPLYTRGHLLEPGGIAQQPARWVDYMTDARCDRPAERAAVPGDHEGIGVTHGPMHP
jgi:hypothetical protein